MKTIKQLLEKIELLDRANPEQNELYKLIQKQATNVLSCTSNADSRSIEVIVNMYSKIITKYIGQ